MPSVPMKPWTGSTAPSKRRARPAAHARQLCIRQSTEHYRVRLGSACDAPIGGGTHATARLIHKPMLRRRRCSPRSVANKVTQVASL
jgi:hypothetical protein